MSVIRLRPLIVVADDEPDALRLVQLCLTRADFAVMTAVDGEEALALIGAHSPDACVLDVAMPHVGGLEVVRRVRAHPPTAGLPIVLLTAAARLSDEASGQDAGADAYLTKPFSPSALVSTVRQLIGERAA